MTKKIAIVGGGAAGFFAAIQAAKRNPAASISIMEGSRKPLSKVLVSGRGRCNVTNHTLSVNDLVEHYPRGARELKGPFSRFAVPDTIEWFKQHGVTLKTEADNRMFPITDRSETVAGCLTEVARSCGVAVELGAKVASITKTPAGKFQVECKGADVRPFDIVILATGGTKSSFSLAQQLGHTIVSPVPSLFTFEIEDPLLEGLEGLSFKLARLQLRIEKKKYVREGPLLITHWGLSGPATIQLSALAARELFESNYKADLFVSFLPEFTTEKLFEVLLKVKQDNPKKQIGNISLFDLPNRFWDRSVKLSGLKLDVRLAECPNAQLNALATILTARVLKVSGKGIFKEEFVTCGGVSLKEIDFKTMQSKLVPGLFFAGEILDIDGITGGFNFQSAWTTGWIAGESC